MGFDPSRYRQVAFSGGGIRCFWHGGFLSQVGAFETVRPERISGVSGGALSGAAWIGGVEQDLKTLMCDAFDQNDANLSAKHGNFTPHEELYRAVVTTTLDENAIAKIAEGPEFQVVLALPPQWLPPRLVAVFAGIAYQIDQRVRSTPHLEWPYRLGMSMMRVDAREAARKGQLVDLVCAAATIPPVFDVPTWQSKYVLDGGMVDKAPSPEPDCGETLFLLTRIYRNLPQMPGRTYVQPSREVAADKIDFTDSSKVVDTWEQGECDARQWLESQGQPG